MPSYWEVDEFRFLRSDTTHWCFRQPLRVKGSGTKSHSSQCNSMNRVCMCESSACSEEPPAFFKVKLCSIQAQFKSDKRFTIKTYWDRSICKRFLWVVGHHCTEVMRSARTADQEKQHEEQHDERVYVSARRRENCCERIYTFSDSLLPLLPANCSTCETF